MAAISINHVTVIFLMFLAEATIDVCFGNGDSHVLCFERERQALLSFKRDLVDDSNKLKSWDVAEEEDCCKWARVVCNSTTGHVSQLNLNEGDFKGKINPSLLNLTHLTHLDLSFNDFGMIKIPSFMDSLVSLRYLNLSQGGFVGKIPHQLGNLSSLRHLDLGNSYNSYLYNSNYLNVENLQWIFGLSSLEYLDMSGVNLSKASDHWLLAINKLPYLKELCLSDCQLNQIPCTFRNNMSLLKYLDLSYNHFGPTIPSCLYSFPLLEHLQLSGNELRGVISSNIANLTCIVSLDLSSNALEGKIPTSMGNLCNLEAIDLSYNSYSGEVSKALESLSGCLSNKLKSLHLNDQLYYDIGNSFTGQIPNEIGKFKNLVYLSLARNNIYGPIPLSIFGKLLTLKSLDISYNNLTGSLPESLGSLSNLEIFYISNNQLNGSLPKSLGSLSNLEVLDISSNQLEGVVSEVHFAKLTKLMELHASENRLTLNVSQNWIPPFNLTYLELRSWKLGPHFPMWLKSQKSIFTMDLSNTGISDAIPYWLWNSSSDKGWIDISRNQIHGEIPNFHHVVDSFSIIYLSSNKLKGPLPRIPTVVDWLDLSNNSLSGDISHFLCDPKADPSRLRILNLKDNLLSGKLPNCWMYWPSLEEIDLDKNNFTGEIPSSMGSLQDLMSLHLRNNSLTGEIPKPLRNCSNLRGLDFGLNKLVGTIPRWIGSLQNLEILVLRSNKLIGHIPIELCSLSNLQILDVGNNRLSGTIPNCFENITTMTNKSQEYEDFFYLGNGLEESRENANLVIKGRANQYDTILFLVMSLDLSGNSLSGEIPKELTSLQALHSLNLSGNYLTGSIPKKIGNMTELESLDLSRNQLSGNIPPSMSSLTFLSYLNLSYNNFSGEIPTSTQLQSLDASGFIGNQLCGPPLPKSCSADHEAIPGAADTEHAERESNEEEYWFRLGVGIGFGVGFAGVVVPLLVCGVWRHAYFWFFQEYLWYKILDYSIKFRYMLPN